MLCWRLTKNIHLTIGCSFLFGLNFRLIETSTGGMETPLYYFNVFSITGEEPIYTEFYLQCIFSINKTRWINPISSYFFIYMV